MEWQPIETAPKDGTIIFVYRPTAIGLSKVAPAKWQSQEHHKNPNPFWQIWLPTGGVYLSRKWEPTHWMPLPSPPSVGGE